MDDQVVRVLQRGCASDCFMGLRSFWRFLLQNKENSRQPCDFGEMKCGGCFTVTKNARKWQKCESCSGALPPWLAAWAGHGPGGLAQYQCRRAGAVVMEWWVAVGSGCSVLTLRFFSEQPHDTSSDWTSCVLAYWDSAVLCHPSILSTTTERAIVKLCGASLELCTLNPNQCWDSKTALAHCLQAILGFVEKRGEWGVLGSQEMNQWSPSVGGAKCGWLRRTDKTYRAFYIYISSCCSSCRAVDRRVLACVHMYMLWDGWKSAPDTCFVSQCKQVYTRGQVLLTLWYVNL